MITETALVEVPVEVYLPLPDVLTRPIPYPEPLDESATVEDLVDRIVVLYDKLDDANYDRAAIRLLLNRKPSHAQNPRQETTQR